MFGILRNSYKITHTHTHTHTHTSKTYICKYRIVLGGKHWASCYQPDFWLLVTLRQEVQNHPPCSPNLTPPPPPVISISGFLKNHPEGNRFLTHADAKQSVISRLQALDTISSTPAYKPWCHVGQMLKSQWVPRGGLTSTFYPRDMFTSELKWNS
jgi:hypothetical protein